MTSQFANGSRILILDAFPPVCCRMIQECCDMRRAHFGWMTFVVRVNEALDPVSITLFGAQAVVLTADGISHLVDQPGTKWKCGLFNIVHAESPGSVGFVPTINVPG